MSAKRVIFGNGPDGISTVLFEGPVRPIGIGDAEIAATSGEAAAGSYLAWAARGTVTDTEDYCSTIPDFNLKLAPGETRFIRSVIAPGTTSPMHRTPNVNDYFVGISGELTMYMEDGSSAKIGPGDMLVQLATWHYLRNEGAEPFVMAGVMIGVETDVDVPYGVEMRDSLD